MKHFELIQKDIDVLPMLEELVRNANAWNARAGQQKKAQVPCEASGIAIRDLRASHIRGRRRCDVHESHNTSLASQFPAVVAFLERFAIEQDAELGRARLVRLGGEGCVHPHVDRGNYYAQRDRFQLVIQSPQGSRLQVGDEDQNMQVGELWWFDNMQVHEAKNASKGDRVHLLFDLLPRVPTRRRSPPPPRIDLESVSHNLNDMLRETRVTLERGEMRVVQDAVCLYLVGREDPRRWERFQQKWDNTTDGAIVHPMQRTISLVLGEDEATAKKVRRCTRVMVWALEEIETGSLRWDQVTDAIAEAGGMRKVAQAWKQAQGVSQFEAVAQ